MTIAIAVMSRIFRYSGMQLPDHDPTLTVDEVKRQYAVAYPELVSAAIEGPTEENGQQVYQFVRAVRTKGGLCEPRT